MRLMAHAQTDAIVCRTIKNRDLTPSKVGVLDMCSVFEDELFQLNT